MVERRRLLLQSRSECKAQVGLGLEVVNRLWKRALLGIAIRFSATQQLCTGHSFSVEPGKLDFSDLGLFPPT